MVSHSARPVKRLQNLVIGNKRGLSMEPSALKRVGSTDNPLDGQAGSVSFSKVARPQNPADTTNVIVGVRCRAFKPNEDGDAGVAVDMDPSNGDCSVAIPGKQTMSYAFDKVFPPESNQQDVFEALGAPLIKNALNGYNSSLLAYGATGSGKTHSMFNLRENPTDSGGDHADQNPNSPVSAGTGLVPRILAAILEEGSKETENPAYNEDGSLESTEEFHPHVDLYMDIVEIYLEDVFDLLHDRAKCRIRGDNRDGYRCEGLKPTLVRDFAHASKLIEEAHKVRSVAATALNDYSSRAHTIVSAEVRTKHPDGWKTARVLFADLAGCERIRAAKTEEGRALDEARNINLSLMALGSCVEAAVRNYMIGAPDRNIARFRDSSLTKLLKECIGGNSRTSILVTVAPGEQHLNSTIHSLRFGNRAKDLKSNAVSNQVKEVESQSVIQNSKEAKKQVAMVAAIQQAMVLRLNIRLQMVQKEESKARFAILKESQAEWVKYLRLETQQILQMRQQLQLAAAMELAAHHGAKGAAKSLNLPKLDPRALRKTRTGPPSARRPTIKVKMPEIRQRVTTKPKSPTWAKKNPRPWERSPGRTGLPERVIKEPTRARSPSWNGRNPNGHDHLGVSSSFSMMSPSQSGSKSPRKTAQVKSPTTKVPKLPPIEPQLIKLCNSEEVARDVLERSETIAEVTMVAAEAKARLKLGKQAATPPKGSPGKQTPRAAALAAKKKDLHPDSPAQKAAAAKTPKPPAAKKTPKAPEPKKSNKAVSPVHAPAPPKSKKSAVSSPITRAPAPKKAAAAPADKKKDSVPAPVVQDNKLWSVSTPPARRQSAVSDAVSSVAPVRSEVSSAGADYTAKLTAVDEEPVTEVKKKEEAQPRAYTPLSERSSFQRTYDSRDSRRSYDSRDSRRKSYDSRDSHRKSYDSRDSRRSSYDSRIQSRSRSRSIDSRDSRRSSRRRSSASYHSRSPSVDSRDGASVQPTRVPTPPTAKVYEKCAHCHNDIVDHAVKYNSDALDDGPVKMHQDCVRAFEEAHAKPCHHCSKPMVDGAVTLGWNGKEVELHEDCVGPYQETIRPKCVKCDKQIMDERGVHTYNGEPHHEQCFVEHLEKEAEAESKGVTEVGEEVDEGGDEEGALDASSSGISPDGKKKKKSKKEKKEKKEKKAKKAASQNAGDVPEQEEPQAPPVPVAAAEKPKTPEEDEYADDDFAEEVDTAKVRAEDDAKKKRQEEEAARQRAEAEKEAALQAERQRMEDESEAFRKQERMKEVEAEAAAARKAAQAEARRKAMAEMQEEKEDEATALERAMQALDGDVQQNDGFSSAPPPPSNTGLGGGGGAANNNFGAPPAAAAPPPPKKDDGPAWLDDW